MEQARIPERYTLIEEVGQGGMAVVYRAQDETLKRQVAIKLLHHHLAAEPESKARLEREAQAVAKLRHENILEIFDYSGLNSASAYIVTEFIDGWTLKQYLEAHTIRYAEVAALIATEVCSALAHAHGVGIIHRDVKPENVMIRKDGLLKLMDFGIAQVLDLQRMTVTGQLLGSPAYMAPEIIEGKPLDFRTDVFSVGIMLYLLSTGSLPFSGKNPHEVLRRITDGKFADPRSHGRGVDASLARIISKALARRAEDRYPDVMPMAAELTTYLAAAGLTDVRAELRAYFCEPEKYEAELPARMAPALTGTGATELSARRTARALELWNRVLAFDPQNAEVATRLRRLEGRARLRSAAIALGAAAALGAALWLGLPYLSRRPPAPDVVTAPVAASPAKPPATPAPATAPETATPPAGAATAPDRPEGPAPARPARRSVAASARLPRAPRPEAPAAAVVEAPPAAPVATRSFMLGPTPQNVDVFLDGQRQFGYDVDHTTLSVPWDGVHVVEFRSPSGCCFVERVEIGPERPLPVDGIIARRLKWRPAHLLVATDPPTSPARVMVRDTNRQAAAATAGRPGEEINVPFFIDDDASKEIEISVDAGDAFATEKIRVRAGQRLRHVIKLKAGGN